jgi:hypothetical protein
MMNDPRGVFRERQNASSMARTFGGVVTLGSPGRVLVTLAGRLKKLI